MVRFIETLLITMIALYFDSRGIEKGQAIKVNKRESPLLSRKETVHNSVSVNLGLRAYPIRIKN